MPRQPIPPHARIPKSITPLVGRDRELASSRQLLRESGVRLVTLTGPGGVGKTLLAMHIAVSSAGFFPGGVVFVDLAPVRDVELVAATIANALDIPDGGHNQLIERIAGGLRARRLLLVLDNLEQVIGCASTVSTLLTLAPSLTILATSREPLRIAGEHERTINPLELLSPGESDLTILAENHAVQLFLQRAAAAHPGFTLTATNAETIVELCTRLDGLPLAIELAAARLRHLSPQALLSRLSGNLALLSGGARDLSTRLQTMHNAIAWSHDLLSPAEKVLFRRLAVFAGGFTADAAEFVADSLRSDAPTSEPTIDLIAQLVDKNLIQVRNGIDQEPRFRFLETIREFGLEELRTSQDDQPARDRHVQWCIDFAEDAASVLTGPERLMLAQQVEQELPNIRQALARAIRDESADRSLRLVAALAPFWEMQGHLNEGEEWAQRALSLPAASRSPFQGAALRGASALSYRLGNYERAVNEAAAALHCGEASGNSLLVAGALITLGSVSYDHGDLEASIAYFEQALTRFRELGDVDGTADALSKVGLVLTGLGDLDRAAATLEESAEIGRRTNRPVWVATSLGRHAFVDQLRGDLDAAERRITEALPVQRDLNPISAVAMLWMAATIARDRNEYAVAAERYRESLELRQKWGEQRGVAESLVGLAELATLTDRLDLAAHLFGGVDALRKKIGVPGYRWEQGRRDRALAKVRTELGLQDFNAAFQLGASTPQADVIFEAIAFALEIESLGRQPSGTPAPADPATVKLTARERDVLKSLANGFTDREIADALFISPRTVARHLHSIYKKLDVSSRSAATAFAHRNRLAG